MQCRYKHLVKGYGTAYVFAKSENPGVVFAPGAGVSIDGTMRVIRSVEYSEKNGEIQDEISVFVGGKVAVPKGYKFRLYRGAPNSASPSLVCFIIRMPYYGKNLDIFIEMGKVAQHDFPQLETSEIMVGTVSNSGYMDRHAVIAFNVDKNWKIPAHYYDYGTRSCDFSY